MAQPALHIYHYLSPSLRDREQAIKDGIAIWEDYYSAGLAWLDLAESVWWLNRRQLQHYDVFLDIANKRFTSAQGCARQLRHQNQRFALATIGCGMAMLYISRSRNPRYMPAASYITMANDVLMDAMRELQLLATDNPRKHPDAWHQLAIAHALVAQLAWDTPQSNADHWAVQANKLFEAEHRQTPDCERAYRLHLLRYAMAKHGSRRRRLANLAIASAKRFGDYAHARHAKAIKWFGPRGEWLIRWHRDRKAVIASL